MNTNIKTAAKLAAFAGAFALMGCADTVHPTYTPPANVAKVPGADKVTVDVVVKNDKKHKDGQISWMKNGYDMSIAGLYMHVRRDFKAAIKKALIVHGFSVANNGNGTVEVIVHHLFSRETNDFSSGVIQNGSGSLTVIVKNNSGNDIYTHNVNFKNDILKPSIWGFTTDRSKIARSMLNVSVNKIFADTGFIHTLTGLNKHSDYGVAIPVLN